MRRTYRFIHLGLLVVDLVGLKWLWRKPEKNGYDEIPMEANVYHDFYPNACSPNWSFLVGFPSWFYNPDWIYSYPDRIISSGLNRVIVVVNFLITCWTQSTLVGWLDCKWVMWHQQLMVKVNGLVGKKVKMIKKSCNMECQNYKKL